MTAPAPEELHTLIHEAVTQGSPAEPPNSSQPVAELEGGGRVNEFCLFLKPELTRLEISPFSKAWGVVDEALRANDVEVLRWAVLPGRILDQSDAIRQHYGVIEAVAAQGESVLSEEALTNLAGLKRTEWAAAEEVLGAYEFLERFPFFSPTALAVLYDNLNSKRLAGGSHGGLVDVRGRKFVLLNGFHPDQVQRYVDPDASIVIFWCQSSEATTWKDLRQKMTGATNPVRAEAGSIRRKIYERRDEFGIPEFNASMNGIHLSAGPLEGAVELARYFGLVRDLNVADTSFGKRLIGSGLSEDNLAKLALNISIRHNGLLMPVFDATEELDSSTALDLLGREGATSND